jgi:hypothetical protein
MKRRNRNMAKRRLMDKIDENIDSSSYLLSKHNYLVNGMTSEWIVNELPWVPSKKQYKIGLFKRIHPRV